MLGTNDTRREFTLAEHRSIAAWAAALGRGITVHERDDEVEYAIIRNQSDDEARWALDHQPGGLIGLTDFTVGDVVAEYATVADALLAIQPLTVLEQAFADAFRPAWGTVWDPLTAP